MVSHKLMGIYTGGFNTRRYIIVHGFCLFKLFPIGPKELSYLIQIKPIFWQVLHSITINWRETVLTTTITSSQ